MGNILFQPGSREIYVGHEKERILAPEGTTADAPIRKFDCVVSGDGVFVCASEQGADAAGQQFIVYVDGDKVRLKLKTAVTETTAKPVGTPVYWDDTAKEVKFTSAAGYFTIGHTCDVVHKGDTLVPVRIKLYAGKKGGK